MKYLEKDWYGKPCPMVGFEVIRSTHWTFKVDVHVPPEKSSIAEPFEYKEGLWEQDVAEWFLVNTTTKQYIEWNLSANGAWWLMPFSGARQRAETLLPSLEAITTRSSQQEGSCQAEIEVPEKLLINLLGDDKWTHNVCFIIGKQPRQYISLNELGSAAPDFHRPQRIITPIR
jgi:hypothetical protein